MAPLVKELALYPDRIDCRVAVTAQHREMLDQVLRLFDLHPYYDLDIMRPGQSLFEVTERALAGMEKVIGQERPELVLVHGDPTTTFAAALAAFYLQSHRTCGSRLENAELIFPFSGRDQPSPDSGCSGPAFRAHCNCQG
jgi:UDP-N-acetylglucosamine 2-epimerase (non-hydrolysing)